MGEMTTAWMDEVIERVLHWNNEDDACILQHVGRHGCSSWDAAGNLLNCPPAACAARWCSIVAARGGSTATGRVRAGSWSNVELAVALTAYLYIKSPRVSHMVTVTTVCSAISNILPGRSSHAVKLMLNTRIIPQQTQLQLLFGSTGLPNTMEGLLAVWLSNPVAQMPDEASKPLACGLLGLPRMMAEAGAPGDVAAGTAAAATELVADPAAMLMEPACALLLPGTGSNAAAAPATAGMGNCGWVGSVGCRHQQQLQQHHQPQEDMFGSGLAPAGYCLHQLSATGFPIQQQGHLQLAEAGSCWSPELPVAAGCNSSSLCRELPLSSSLGVQAAAGGPETMMGGAAVDGGVGTDGEWLRSYEQQLRCELQSELEIDCHQHQIRSNERQHQRGGGIAAAAAGAVDDGMQCSDMASEPSTGSSSAEPLSGLEEYRQPAVTHGTLSGPEKVLSLRLHSSASEAQQQPFPGQGPDMQPFPGQGPDRPGSWGPSCYTRDISSQPSAHTSHQPGAAGAAVHGDASGNAGAMPGLVAAAGSSWYQLGQGKQWLHGQYHQRPEMPAAYKPAKRSQHAGYHVGCGTVAGCSSSAAAAAAEFSFEAPWASNNEQQTLQQQQQQQQQQQHAVLPLSLSPTVKQVDAGRRLSPELPNVSATLTGAWHAADEAAPNPQGGTTVQLQDLQPDPVDDDQVGRQLRRMSQMMNKLNTAQQSLTRQLARIRQARQQQQRQQRQQQQQQQQQQLLWQQQQQQLLQRQGSNVATTCTFVPQQSATLLHQQQAAAAIHAQAATAAAAAAGCTAGTPPAVSTAPGGRVWAPQPGTWRSAGAVRPGAAAAAAGGANTRCYHPAPFAVAGVPVPPGAAHAYAAAAMQQQMPATSHQGQQQMPATSHQGQQQEQQNLWRQLQQHEQPDYASACTIACTTAPCVGVAAAGASGPGTPGAAGPAPGSGGSEFPAAAGSGGSSAGNFSTPAGAETPAGLSHVPSMFAFLTSSSSGSPAADAGLGGAGQLLPADPFTWEGLEDVEQLLGDILEDAAAQHECLVQCEQLQQQ